MATETASYDIASVPACTVTRETSTTTGRNRFTASVELLEIDPERGVTLEEQRNGINSINPPTVSASTANDLIRLSIEACASAYAETPGLDFDGEVLASLSYRVSHSVLQALRLLGEDV